jgi:hypothetical protein
MENEMGRAYSTHEGEAEYVYDLVEKPEGKRPLRRSKRRWEVDITYYRLDSSGSG